MAFDKTVLVTGAHGLVGQAVCTKFRDAGARVLAVARAPESGDSITVDLAKGTLVDKVSHVPAVVVHLAAAVPHDPRYPDTESSAGLTREIDKNVFAAAQSWNSRVIYVSSCGLYDRLDHSIKSPASPVSAVSPYFSAKQDGETLFAQLPDTACLRLSAPIGPGLKPSLVAARFMKQCKAGLPIEIWGSGEREQDFIHVGDMADLIFLAAQSQTKGTFNAASGEPVTMIALAEAVIATIGRGSWEFADREDPCDGETARYAIDQTMATFAWKPRYTLSDMIRSVVESQSGVLTEGSRHDA